MAKLTLNVDPDVIQRAKRYAAERGVSVSKLVTRYLEVVSSPQPDAEGAPVLRRLRGCARGAVPVEQDYRDVLVDKYR